MIETRRVDCLTPHLQQAELAEAELQELAADMRSNGLIHAVEILSDGTIIAGHQRVRAAEFLGWTTITCWVRTDLAAAGDELERLMVRSKPKRPAVPSRR